MDVIASRLESEKSFPPPSLRTGKSETRNEPPCVDGEHMKLPEAPVLGSLAHTFDVSSSSSSNNELDTDRSDDDCDKMIEKWRLIRLVDKNRAQKKIYRTSEEFATRFGKNYSKFYQAFQRGVNTNEAPKRPTATVPAKRSATASNQPSKKRRQDARAPLPRSDQHQARTISPQRSVATTARVPAGAKSKEFASSADVARQSSVTPNPTSDSAAKEQPTRRKGVGLYAGNWEYVTDEEKVPEYLSVVQKTADFEGRTTRRAYANLTTNEGARHSGNQEKSPSSGSQVRKSGRARKAVDYSRLTDLENNAREDSAPEDNTREIATTEQLGENDASLAQKTKQISRSTSASSTSDRSTSVPDHISRPTSTSTSINTEQHERPKRSWNAIVYEVLATSDTTLTFPQLMQAIKDRYPYFNSSSQDKVLKSGPKNPLYFHEAFVKGEIVNGKQTWGLRPGKFVDKKTGEVLTPQPRHTISSPMFTEQVHEVEDRNPVDLTPKVSYSHPPRSGNPRFGREILNSPEIPDSQEAKTTTSSPEEADSCSSSKHATHVPEPSEAQQLADAADDTSETAFVGISQSGQTQQPSSQSGHTTDSPKYASSASQLPIAAGMTNPDIQHTKDSLDHAPTEAQVLRNFPDEPSSESSSQSSKGKYAHYHNSPSSQNASAFLLRIQNSPLTYLPSIHGDRAPTS